MYGFIFFIVLLNKSNYQSGYLFRKEKPAVSMCFELQYKSCSSKPLPFPSPKYTAQQPQLYMVRKIYTHYIQ